MQQSHFHSFMQISSAVLMSIECYPCTKQIMFPSNINYIGLVNIVLLNSFGRLVLCATIILPLQMLHKTSQFFLICCFQYIVDSSTIIR